MNLIRDVMDTQLIRRNGHRMGKVDGLVIELREGAPPRLAYIETGAHVLARRLGPRFERWTRSLRRLLVGGGETTVRVPWSGVRDVGVDIEIDAAETSATQLQEWLVQHVVRHVPGTKQ
jgi:sporulation protein YlmC with PRC-barrel domain